MKLFTHDPEPGVVAVRAINAILEISGPERVDFEDFKITHPNHRVTAWRSLVAWGLNRQLGFAQAEIAGWFGIAHATVCRNVLSVDRIRNSKNPQQAKSRELIESVAKKIKTLSTHD